MPVPHAPISIDLRPVRSITLPGRGRGFPQENEYRDHHAAPTPSVYPRVYQHPMPMQPAVQNSALRSRYRPNRALHWPGCGPEQSRRPGNSDVAEQARQSPDHRPWLKWPRHFRLPKRFRPTPCVRFSRYRLLIFPGYLPADQYAPQSPCAMVHFWIQGNLESDVPESAPAT